MPIIRREQLVEHPRFSFGDIEAESQRMLAEARAEANAIVEAARAAAEQEAVEIRTQTEAEARTRGYEEGKAEALAKVTETATAEARAQLESLCKALSTLHANYAARQHALLAESERGILELALAIAARVCRTPRSEPAEIARNNVQALLETVGPRHDLVVELNPGDCALLQQAAPDWLNSGQAPKLQANEALQPGDVHLHGPDGTIDASIETQLQRIADALLPTAPEAPQE